MVRGKVRYVPNHESFGRFIMSDQARGPVIKAAFDIVEAAAATAAKRTGDYAKSFDIRSTTVTLQGNPRASAEVFNSDPAAASQEFGLQRGGKRIKEGNRTLRKAGEQAVGPPPAGQAL